MKKHESDKKVFCIGTWKTGTTSMGNALQLIVPNAKYCGWSLRGRYLYLDNKIDEILKTAESFNVFDDTPWNCEGIWQLMYSKFKNSCFILTVRDVDSWFDSFSRWYVDDFIKFEKIPRPATKDVIRLYQRQMPDNIKVVDKADIQKNKNFWKDWYLKRNDRIRNFFKNDKDRFLEYHIGSENSWKSICNFLQVPIPAANFPYLNKNKNGKKWN